VKDDRIYLVHIQDCIIWIRRFTVEGRESFLGDRKTQDAVIRNLQILAESTQRLSAEVKASQPGVDWRLIARFRNFVVHNYLGVNVERIWAIVEQELGPLEQAVQDALDNLGPASQDAASRDDD